MVILRQIPRRFVAGVIADTGFGQAEAERAQALPTMRTPLCASTQLHPLTTTARRVRIVRMLV